MIIFEMKNANVKKNECMNASAGTKFVGAAVIAIAGIILGKLDTVFTNSLKRGREAKKEQVLQVAVPPRSRE